MALNLASPPPPPPPPLFDDEDDFGEFEFVAIPSSLPPLHSNGYNLSHQSQNLGGGGGGRRRQDEDGQDEDEWGEFVESPLQSGSDPDPIRSGVPIPASDKSWEKPSGAIPLSIFGEAEVEEPDSLPPPPPPLSFDVVFSPSKPPARKDPAFGPCEGISDLIADLYGEADKIGSAGNNDGVAPDLTAHDGDDGFDESSWEFKDALSDSLGRDSRAGQLQLFGNRWEYNQRASLPSRVQNDEQDRVDMFAALENGFDDDPTIVRQNRCSPTLYYETEHIKTEKVLSPNLANGHSIIDGNFWEFKDELSEIGFTNGQQVEQKVADQSGTTANLFTSSASIQDTGRLWDNNLGVLSESTFMINGKQDPDDFSETQDGVSCEFTYESSGGKKLNSGSVIAINDLISNLYEADQTFAVDSTQKPTDNGQDSAESVLNAHIVKDDNHLNTSQGVLKHAIADQTSMSILIDAMHNISTKPALEVFVDFYTRLKDKSCIVTLYHLDDLKEAHQSAVLSGEKVKSENVDLEIQDAYAKLQVVGDVCMEERQPKDVAVNELLQVGQEPCFQALEKEYHLSEKMSLAVKNLSSSLWLYEHAISMLHILMVASYEEQRAYIITWSKLGFACAKELQHGAMIWSQSLQANVHTQILSEFRGSRYFIALGEIYRVTQVLRASFTLYKPWMMSNPADSTDILTSLEKCTSAWMNSGLRNALESISDLMVNLEQKEMIKALLESINLIHDLSFIDLQRYATRCDEPICRISLLPLSTLQDMEAVVWCGKHYFLKLANSWANLVSHDPPQLPEIHVNVNGTG